MTEEDNPPPMVAHCHRLAPLTPLSWLMKGWQDCRRAPKHSILYGLFFVIISYVIFLSAWAFNSISLAIGLLSAFVFLAPVLCIGLYSISRQLKRNQPINFRKSLRHGIRPYGDLAMFIIVVMVISLIWARSASMIHIFMPSSTTDSIADLLMFLSIGSLVGSFFAALVFSVSVFSLPMVMDKKVDMMTCCLSSLNAVLRNKTTMIFWGLIVVILTGIGILSGFLGFLVIMPVLGYATWHGYRDTLDAGYWPDRIMEFSKKEEEQVPSEG